MAVGRNYTGKKPLNERQLNTAITQLSRMRICLRTLITHDVTQDDLLTTFVKPEHRSVLVEAARICAPDNVCFSTKIETESELRLDIVINTKPKFILPKYIGKFRNVNVDVSEQKLIEFAHALRKFHVEYYTGIEAIKTLNERCNSLTQMRFFLKCLPALGIECKYKVPSDIPDIPRELRNTLRSVDEFVARASMLPEDTVEDERDVKLDLTGRVKVELPWKPNTNFSFYM